MLMGVPNLEFHCKRWGYWTTTFVKLRTPWGSHTTLFHCRFAALDCTVLLPPSASDASHQMRYPLLKASRILREGGIGLFHFLNGPIPLLGFRSQDGSVTKTFINWSWAYVSKSACSISLLGFFGPPSASGPTSPSVDLIDFSSTCFMLVFLEVAAPLLRLLLVLWLVQKWTLKPSFLGCRDNKCGSPKSFLTQPIIVFGAVSKYWLQGFEVVFDLLLRCLLEIPIPLWNHP